MYSESDIEAAIAAGALTPEAAAALRAHAAHSAGPSVDEENIRLITSFNDIFVTIASILLLVAVGWIGASAGPMIASFGVAAAAWGLAEYFTRQRHMALPSIFLLISFVWSVFSGTMVAFTGILFSGTLAPRLAIYAALAAAITTAAAYAHWRRFYVPITIAAGTCALVGLILSLVLATIPAAANVMLGLMLVAGLAVFAFAMWWDMSDRSRVSRRSDVAFWLHLVAAPMIVHPIFRLLGLLQGEAGSIGAAVVILVYCLFGIVALAVDRRALLVSALLYVLYALSALLKQFGAVNLNFAFTALIIGSALLLLSAFWHSARAAVLGFLPDEWQERLPSLNR